MSLPFEALQRPFAFGLAEGVDPLQAPPGTLTVAKNVEWVKGGLLQKRLGADRMSNDIFGGGSLASGSRLLTRGDELFAISEGLLHSYSPALDAWTLVDEVPDVELTWKTALDPSVGIAFHDSCITPSGLIVHVWATGDPLTYVETAHEELFVRVEDASGEIVMPAKRVMSNPGGVRVLYDSASNRALLLYCSGPTGVRVLARALDLATLTLLTERTLSTTWRGELVDGHGGCFDAWYDTGSPGDFIIVYEDIISGGTVADLRRERYTYNSGPDTYTQTASVGTDLGLATGDNVRSIAIDGLAADGFLWVAYGSRSAGRIRIMTIHPTTLATVTAFTNVGGTLSESFNVSVKRKSATVCLLAFTLTNLAVTRQYAVSVEVSNLNIVDQATWRGTAGARFISRVFECNGRHFAFALRFEIPPSGTQNSPFDGADTHLVEMDTVATTVDYTTPVEPVTASFVPHRYLGRVDVLIGGLSMEGTLASAVTTGTYQRRLLLPFLSAVPQGRTNYRCGLRHVDFKIQASTDHTGDMWRGVDCNGEAYIAGSLLQAYDGRFAFDYGFPCPPTFSTINTATPAGSMENGAHLYGWHYEFRSDVGILHRGPTSTVQVPSAGGSPGQVTLGWVTSSFTSKNDMRTDFQISTSHRPAGRVLVPVYRSEADKTVLHRLSYEPNFTTVYWDPLVTQQPAFVDGTASSNIGDNVKLAVRPQIYTAGGILDDEQPPSGLTIHLHRDRLWMVTGSKREVWFSKTFQDDFGVAPGFSTSFRLLFNKDIHALSTIDEKLIVFGPDSLWYVIGDGPAADGSNTDFTTATQIQTDVGCTQPRSIVAMPEGTMFADASGIYLLTRSLEVQFIGLQVQDTFDLYPVITSAVLVSSRNQVRFTMVKADGSEGIVLVYDYALSQWATRTYLAGAPIASAILWNGQWTAITTAGVVIREKVETDATAYLDDGVFVPSTIETTWISRSGPVAFQRVRRFYVLSTQMTDCDVSMSFFVDGSNAAFETKAWTSDELPTRVGIHVAKQKSFAIKGRFSDAAPSGIVENTLGNGQGMLWSMLGLELAQKKGLEKRAEGAKK